MGNTNGKTLWFTFGFLLLYLIFSDLFRKEVLLAELGNEVRTNLTAQQLN